MTIDELRITVSGEEPARDAALNVLKTGMDVSSVSRPYPNREDPGARVYVHARPRPQGPMPADAPLVLAQDAKRRRDLGAELAILTGAQRDLESQPWLPLQAGDVVLMYLPDAAANGGPLGETYLAVDDPDGFGVGLRQVSTRYGDDVGPAGEPANMCVAHGEQGDPEDADWFCPRCYPNGPRPEPVPDPLLMARLDSIVNSGIDDEDQDDESPSQAREYLYSIEDLWFEAGAATLSVIRAGAVLFGTPAAVPAR